MEDNVPPKVMICQIKVLVTGCKISPPKMVIRGVSQRPLKQYKLLILFTVDHKNIMKSLYF